MDDGDGASSYADDECVDLDSWEESVGNDEDDVTTNYQLTQHFGTGCCYTL